MSGIEIPEEPKGIGSIIRVVFKDAGDGDSEAFYVGVAPGLWAEYGGIGEDEFTWQQMLQIISLDEAEVFEVVYEGLWASEADEAQHPKDWIWKEGL